MEILDNNLPIKVKLTKELIAEKLKLKQDYPNFIKKVNHARVALGIVSGFTFLSLFGLLEVIEDALTIGLIITFTLVFGICAAVCPKHAKYSLSIGLILYLLNLIGSLFQFSPFMVIGLIVKGVIIYYLVVGLQAAIKLSKIIKRMNFLDIKPYNI